MRVSGTGHIDKTKGKSSKRSKSTKRMKQSAVGVCMLAR